MRAYVIEEPGGAEQFQLRELPTPTARPGWVVIRIRAFGLNRSEWFTRRGDSPSVKFPRVLGIECVGEVADPSDSDLAQGQTVAAIMGGLGRDFDGSYAEYTVVPREIVFPLDTKLPWTNLAALPEMLQTVHGSLHVGLEVERAKNLLVRGATSSIGFATMAMARRSGLEVTATTRSAGKEQALKDAGATHVLVDDGRICDAARQLKPEGFDRVLELIGATTLKDSLKAARTGGIVCMTGILGGAWVLPEFEPMGDIPTGVKLTSYAGGALDITREQLQQYVSWVEAGELEIRRGPVMPFELLVEAHQLMDANRASGKIVIELPDSSG